MSTATKPRTKPKMIDAALRAAIRRDGRTYYALAAASGVTPQQIGRFVRPEGDDRRRGISLETAALLAAALGLELRPVE